MPRVDPTFPDWLTEGEAVLWWEMSHLVLGDMAWGTSAVELNTLEHAALLHPHRNDLFPQLVSLCYHTEGFKNISLFIMLEWKCLCLLL